MENQEIKKEIEDRLKILKSGDAHRYFIKHLDYPTKQKERDKKEIQEIINPIEKILPDIKKLIKNIKNNIRSICDQTKISAAYLLLGKTYSNIETLLTLAKIGKNLEIMDIRRSADESLGLTVLFLEDGNAPLLEKWFAGVTIENKKSRKALDKLINRDDELTKEMVIPIEKMSSNVYGILSKYTHSSYAALLDAVDILHEDFDFDTIAGFHYTKENFHIIQNLVASLMTHLKNVFLNLKDDVNFKEADRIYKLINPSPLSQEKINELIKKFH